MHEITYEVEEVDTTPEPTEDDPDPEQQTDYILHITVSSKTVDELAESYQFHPRPKRYIARTSLR